MTCIVGLVDEASGKVFIGGDSAAIDESYNLTVVSDAKVFANGPYVLGFAGSFRLGNLLRYSFAPPRPIVDDLLRFMVVDFIGEVRKVLFDGGVVKTEESLETVTDESAFLVGVAGRLFHIQDDFNVSEAIDLYDACGAGHAVAKGSLFSTKRLAPKRRVQTALEAAERHSGSIRPPFKILSTRPA